MPPPMPTVPDRDAIGPARADRTAQRSPQSEPDTAAATSHAARPDGVGDTVREDGASDPAGPGDDDTAWFERLVREHATAVHRYVLRRAGHDDAEDLTADVLAVAWRRRGDVPRGAELPWLYRTAGFVVANHRRKGRPVPVGDVPDEVDHDDPALRAVADERVREVLGLLGARDRQILLLNAWEGLTGDGLAQVLGITRGGADAALSRARARLREVWAEA